MIFGKAIEKALGEAFGNQSTLRSTEGRAQLAEGPGLTKGMKSPLMGNDHPIMERVLRAFI